LASATLLVAGLAVADSPKPSAAPERPPETPRDFFNAGTAQFGQKKLREAEASLTTAVAANQPEIQVAALYNLGHVRFQQGADALKQSPDPAATRARGDAAGELADRAIRSAEDALKSGESASLLRAYLEGRGARKELKEALKAVDKAMEAHRTTLLRWERSAGDFKSAFELQPVLDDASFNGQVVDRHIARLVDQQEQLKQCMGGMGRKMNQLAKLMKQMKGQMPGGTLPKGGDEDEEDEDGKGPQEPKQEDGPGKEREKENQPNGQRMALSREEAEVLLNSFKLDANRKLGMGDRDTAKPKDRQLKDY
jgi:hypothetical protein